MTVVAICGASVGHYGRPLKIAGPSPLRFISEDYKPLRCPKWLSCDGPDHDRLTPGHHKRRFLSDQGYWQRWTLGRRETKRAVAQWDVMSLEVPPRVLCPACGIAGVKGAEAGEAR